MIRTKQIRNGNGNGDMKRTTLPGNGNGKKVGRPSKYYSDLDDIVAEWIVWIAPPGCVTEYFIAKYLGIGHSTYEEWKRAYPSFQATIKKGIDSHFARHLAEKRDNFGGLIFVAKNVARWTDRREIEDKSPAKQITHTIQVDWSSIPKKDLELLYEMPPEQRLKYIDMFSDGGGKYIADPDSR